MSNRGLSCPCGTRTVVLPQHPEEDRPQSGLL